MESRWLDFGQAFFFIFIDQAKLEVNKNTHKITRPVYSHLDHASLLDKGFIIWPKRELLLSEPMQEILNWQDGHLARASDILRKKNQNFAGFSGANSRKNRPISQDFRGKKVKIRGKIARFPGILAEKIKILKDFQGQILRKIGRFHRKFWGETSPRNNQ